MLGPYLVFLGSTVNGYEGTGRSLSLKLLAGLRAAGAKLSSAADTGAGSSSASRTLRELTLEAPIRYAPGDGVEAWLHAALCLDAASALPPPPSRLPVPPAVP